MYGIPDRKQTVNPQEGLLDVSTKSLPYQYLAARAQNEADFSLYGLPDSSSSRNQNTWNIPKAPEYISGSLIIPLAIGGYKIGKEVVRFFSNWWNGKSGDKRSNSLPSQGSDFMRQVRGASRGLANITPMESGLSSSSSKPARPRKSNKRSR